MHLNAVLVLSVIMLSVVSYGMLIMTWRIRVLFGVLIVVVWAYGWRGDVSAQSLNICPAANLPVTLEGEWTTVAPMPTQRSEIASTVLDGRLYVVGGFAVEDGVTTAVEVYDPTSDSWETRAPLPIPLHHPSIAAHDGKIYTAGGYTDMNFTPTDQAFSYDPALDNWTPIAPIPQPVGAHMLVSLGDRVYFIGGAPGGFTLWAYDRMNDEWITDLSQMPTQREHLGAAAHDGKLYVVGGRWTNNLASVDVYDPEADEWSQAEPMPTARGGFSVATVNGLIFAGGGEAFSAGGSCTFNRAEFYNPETNTWGRIPDMPTARHGITSASLDGKWYVIGGGMGAGGATFTTMTDVIEVFTPATS